MIQAIRDGGLEVYATVKVDGSSGTAWREDGRLRVCSRNWELRESDANVFWACANQYLSTIPEGFAVQFEAVGPGIQGNPAGRTRVMPLAFQVYAIQERRYLDKQAFWDFCDDAAIPVVSFIEPPTQEMLASDDLLRTYAEGQYPNGKPREGVVIRPVIEQLVPTTGERVSFKVINLMYRD